MKLFFESHKTSSCLDLYDQTPKAFLYIWCHWDNLNNLLVTCKLELLIKCFYATIRDNKCYSCLCYNILEAEVITICLCKSQYATAVAYIHACYIPPCVCNKSCVDNVFYIHKIITYNTFTHKNTYTVISKFVLA